MIVHGIQVPRVRAASLAAPLIGVQVRAESREADHRGHPVVRVGSRVDTHPTIIQDMMTGYLVLTLSLNGIPLQTVKVVRATVIVAS